MIRFGSGARMGHGHGAYGGPEHGSSAARLMLNPLPHHNKSNALISASPERVFALVDDHERLSAHMSQSSWRMGGGHMTTTFDEGHGQRVGSHVLISGHLLGLNLSLDEVVTQREPPARKVWETWCTQRMVNDAVGHLASDANPSPAVRARGLEKS